MIDRNVLHRLCIIPCFIIQTSPTSFRRRSLCQGTQSHRLRGRRHTETPRGLEPWLNDVRGRHWHNSGSVLQHLSQYVALENGHLSEKNAEQER